jgi:hypothetical protein
MRSPQEDLRLAPEGDFLAGGEPSLTRTGRGLRTWLQRGPEAGWETSKACRRAKLAPRCD